MFVTNAPIPEGLVFVTQHARDSHGLQGWSAIGAGFVPNPGQETDRAHLLEHGESIRVIEITQPGAEPEIHEVRNNSGKIAVRSLTRNPRPFLS